MLDSGQQGVQLRSSCALKNTPAGFRNVYSFFLLQLYFVVYYYCFDFLDFQLDIKSMCGLKC